MTPRIYLPPEHQADEEIRLDTEQSQYLCQALRLRAGEQLQVFDGRGGRRQAELLVADRKAARLRLGPAISGLPAPAKRLTLIQGVASGDRMDWIVEKAVEIGVCAVIPVLCERGDVKLSAERALKRLAHWQRVAVAACRQSGRDDLPTIHPVTSLATWFSANSPAGPLAYVLAPGSAASLAAQLRGADTSGQRDVTVLVGPESGLSDAEIATATQVGFAPASAGPRVLRTETAGLVAATIVQAIIGDLSPGNDSP